MNKIIKKEEFYKNSTVYTRLVLDSSKIEWLVNTTLTNIPDSRKEQLEKEYQIENPPLEKEVD